LIFFKLQDEGFQFFQQTPSFKTKHPTVPKKVLAKIYGCNLIGFSLKEITSPLRSMYPYPVSGFVGTTKSNNISADAFNCFDCLIAIHHQ
jgi:hypothetical protein